MNGGSWLQRALGVAHTALALALAVIFTSAPAAAQAPLSPPSRHARVSLDHVLGAGAEQCASARELTAAVEARLGRAVFVAREQADLYFEVRAQRRARRFIIELEMRAATGEALGTRRLETAARHCSALDDSLALVLSLAADVPVRRQPEVNMRPSDAEGLTPLGLTPIVLPASSYAPRAPWRAGAALGLAASAGLLPRPGAAAQLRLELEPPDFWRFGVAASLWHGQRLGGAGAGARFSARTLELSLCPWRPRFEPWALAVCAQELVGRVRASGYGFDRTETSERWLLDFGLGVVAHYELGPAFLAAFGSLLVPLVQRRYFYTEGGQVTLYDAPWASAVLGVSFGALL